MLEGWVRRRALPAGRFVETGYVCARTGQTREKSSLQKTQLKLAPWFS
jgi:hypothetical protein